MGFLKVMSSLRGNENYNNKQKCGDIESKNRHLTISAPAIFGTDLIPRVLILMP